MGPEPQEQARGRQAPVRLAEGQVVVPVLRRHSCKVWAQAKARVPEPVRLVEVLGPLVAALVVGRAPVGRGAGQVPGLAAAKLAGR